MAIVSDMTDEFRISFRNPSKYKKGRFGVVFVE